MNRGLAVPYSSNPELSKICLIQSYLKAAGRFKARVCSAYETALNELGLFWDKNADTITGLIYLLISSNGSCKTPNLHNKRY